MRQPDPSTFLPLSPTDFQVLLALTSASLHGYAIMKAVEEASAGRVQVAVGSLYRIIGRLLTSRLIEEVEEPDTVPRPGKQRRKYGLTPLGIAVVRAEAQRLKDTVSQTEVLKLLADGKGTS